MAADRVELRPQVSSPCHRIQPYGIGLDRHGELRAAVVGRTATAPPNCGRGESIHARRDLAPGARLVGFELGWRLRQVRTVDTETPTAARTCWFATSSPTSSTIDHGAIVTATLNPPPKWLGVTHWSSRPLAARLEVSPATVARASRAYGV